VYSTGKATMEILLTFVVIPWISIRPADELLVNPREQPHWRVREAVPKRLWLRGLLGYISMTVLEIVLSPFEAFFLRLRVAEEEMGQQDEGSFDRMRRNSSINSQV
jgi:hypothetical protein